MLANIAFRAKQKFALVIQNGPTPDSGGVITFTENLLEMGLHKPEEIECLIDLPAKILT